MSRSSDWRRSNGERPWSPIPPEYLSAEASIRAWGRRSRRRVRPDRHPSSGRVALDPRKNLLARVRETVSRSPAARFSSPERREKSRGDLQEAERNRGAISLKGNRAAISPMPGEGLEPSCREAVVLKTTVSDQFHHPGGSSRRQYRRLTARFRNRGSANRRACRDGPVSSSD